MKVSINRLFILAALVLIMVAGALALFPMSTQAADQPLASSSSPAHAWYGNYCPYVVVDGDDLYRIAFRFSISPYYLAMSNGLYSPYAMYWGMVMQVPCISPYSSSNYQSPGYSNYRQQGYGNYQPYGSRGYMPQGYSSNYQSQGYSPNYQSTPYNVCGVHFVIFGEWLKLISLRFGVPWQSIAVMNRLSNPNFIFAGERLLIPCAQGSTYSPYAPPASGYRAPSSGYQAPGAGAPTPAPVAGTVTATMMNIMFNPATINIHVGQSVRWQNMDSVQHSATQGACSGNTCMQAAGGFDTGILNPGQTSAPILFNTAGTFHFYCRVHGAMMQGDVVVTP